MARDREAIHTLTDEEFVVLEQLREARLAKAEWEAQEKRCRSAILDAVGEAGKLYYGGNYVADLEDRTSSRFDRKQFKLDWPKLDSEYQTTTHSTVVNLIGGADPEQTEQG